MAAKAKVLSERAFVDLIVTFSKQLDAERVVVNTRGGKLVSILSHAGMLEFDERPPLFSDAGWAQWIAFRLLHPRKLIAFERQLVAMFARYKAGTGKWVAYNEDKRLLLETFLRQPYAPKGRATVGE